MAPRDAESLIGLGELAVRETNVFFATEQMFPRDVSERHFKF